MRRLASIGKIIAVLLVFALSGTGHAQSPAAATEKWQSVVDDGKGTGEWTFTRKADGQVDVSGIWIYDKTVKCPFTTGRVTIASYSAFSFIVKGTATDSAAPSGYQQSQFTLEVKGQAADGKVSGTYAISFYTEGWPRNLTGKWTASKVEGGGITQQP
jgi:hypothetical protein